MSNPSTIGVVALNVLAITACTFMALRPVAPAESQLLKVTALRTPTSVRGAYAPRPVHPVVMPQASYQGASAQPSEVQLPDAETLPVEYAYTTALGAQTTPWAPLLAIATTISGVVLLLARATARQLPAAAQPLIPVDLAGAPCRLAMASMTGTKPWGVGNVSPTEEGFRVMAKAEIPLAIPRPDLMDQLCKWAVIQFEGETGQSKFKAAMEVEPQANEDGQTMSFLITIPTEDGPLRVQACLDDERMTMKREGAGGFGKEVAQGTDGAQEGEIIGRNFIMRRQEHPIPDSVRPVLMGIIQEMVNSVNNYYAFGSVYAVDAT